MARKKSDGKQTTEELQKVYDQFSNELLNKINQGKLDAAQAWLNSYTSNKENQKFLKKNPDLQKFIEARRLEVQGLAEMQHSSRTDFDYFKKQGGPSPEANSLMQQYQNIADSYFNDGKQLIENTVAVNLLETKNTIKALQKVGVTILGKVPEEKSSDEEEKEYNSYVEDCKKAGVTGKSVTSDQMRASVKKPLEKIMECNDLEALNKKTREDIIKDIKGKNIKGLEKWINIGNQCLLGGNVFLAKAIISNITRNWGFHPFDQNEREKEIMVLKGQGLSDDAVRALKFLLPHTGQKHISEIYLSSISEKFQQNNLAPLPDIEKFKGEFERVILNTVSNAEYNYIKEKETSELINPDKIIKNVTDLFKKHANITIQPLNPVSSTAGIMSKARAESTPTPSPSWQAPVTTRSKATSEPVIGRRSSNEEPKKEAGTRERSDAKSSQEFKKGVTPGAKAPARRNARGEIESTKEKHIGLDPATGLPKMDASASKPPKKPSGERKRQSSDSDKENKEEESPTPNRPRS